MFELDDKIVEAMIFSMENQDTVSFVDSDTGEISVGPGDPSREEAGQEDPLRYEPLPIWTSQDGFHLMEQFAQTLGHPLARAELQVALSRGRGVFRAFKNALEAHPEAEKKWYEYKERAMKSRIVCWYEELRELHGLSRLGLEPEDADDLLLSDFQIVRYGSDALSGFEPLIRAGKEDAYARFPTAFVEYEFSRMEGELGGPLAGEFSIYAAECEPKSCAGMAILRTVLVAERSFGKLVYLYVDPERRRIGLGRRLAEYAREQLASTGIRHFMVDIPFLWQEFGSSLETLGYSSFGTRWMKSTDV